jgi:hypothetical protein
MHRLSVFKTIYTNTPSLAKIAAKDRGLDVDGADKIDTARCGTHTPTSRTAAAAAAAAVSHRHRFEQAAGVGEAEYSSYRKGQQGPACSRSCSCHAQPPLSNMM